jgi:methylenetetrahydrofolate reductase (NADPH)
VLQLDGEVKIPTAPHLSCVGDTKAELRELLNLYKSAGIKRIVALRGDLPSGMGMASSGWVTRVGMAISSASNA